MSAAPTPAAFTATAEPLSVIQTRVRSLVAIETRAKQLRRLHAAAKPFGIVVRAPELGSGYLRLSHVSGLGDVVELENGASIKTIEAYIAAIISAVQEAQE